ncbi:hypothetical protein KKA85_08060 [bacterium]|nr:hypothetical protein [bacterium]MBU1675720.1 hypothetical protein [bacterium]
MKHEGLSSGWSRVLLACGLILLPVAARAQSVTLSTLVSAQECVALLPLDGKIYAGLSDGGVLIWDQAGDGVYERWTSREGLGSNRVTDLATDGGDIWVATDGAGLTRITLSGGEPGFRLFTNIGVDLSVSAVAALEGTANERVYFGLTNGGVGVISSGLPGNISTSDGTQGGLVNDRIRDLKFAGSDLWIATDEGVSRLRENAFTDMSAGIGYTSVACLLDDPAAGLLAGAASGVWSWDDDLSTWSPLGAIGASVLSLASYDGDVWALTTGTGAAGRLHRWNGSTWLAGDLPVSGALAIAAGDLLWAGGTSRPLQSNYKALQAWAASYDGIDWTPWITDELLFTSVDGVAVAPDGGVWMGARQGAGFARFRDDTWHQVFQLAVDAPDSVGLFNIDGGFMDVDVLPDGEVWMTQFGAGGVIRYRPDLPDCDHLNSDNSGLSSNRVLRIVHHPDGPVLLLSDRQGVDVLHAPASWRDPTAWLHLPTDNTGLGSVNVSDAIPGATPDHVWFVVKDVGLVLWDVNGAAADGDQPLTWDDQADDTWAPPLTSIVDTSFDFTGAQAVAVAGDGTVWVGGGGGVIHFRLDGYGDAYLEVTHLHSVRETGSTSQVGLMQGSVLDIELDRNDDLWVAHAAGLDRVKLRDGEVQVDAFTGAGQYAGFGLGSNYSPDILSGLPDGMVRELASDTTGSLLVAGSEGGAILIEVGPATAATLGPLDRLYLYPNPLKPAEHTGLYLGNISAEVIYGYDFWSGGAHVEIFTIEGQLVYRDRHVADDTPFWTGVNLEGAPVASGVYLVRVQLEGQVAVKPVTVAR